MSEPSSSLSSTAVLAVRLLGLIFVLLGLWLAIANLIDGWMEFDPTYLGYFLRSQLLRPGLAMFFGALLIALSRRVARLLLRGLATP